MTRKYFGTDGIRGRVNTSRLTPEVALKAGMAAGKIFTRGEHRHRVDRQCAGKGVDQPADGVVGRGKAAQLTAGRQGRDRMGGRERRGGKARIVFVVRHELPR